MDLCWRINEYIFYLSASEREGRIVKSERVGNNLHEIGELCPSNFVSGQHGRQSKEARKIRGIEIVER